MGGLVDRNKFWLLLIGAMVLCGSHWLAYSHGLSVKESHWQSKWNQRDADEAQARISADAIERQREQDFQKNANRIEQDAKKQIETALTHAADAQLAADGLRSKVSQLLASERTRGDSCATSRSPPAENPGNLLAVLLDKSVERNRELAALADTSRIAGQACQAAYESIRTGVKRNDP